MDSRPTQPSVFERFVAGFTRLPGGELLSTFGPRRGIVESSWEQIQSQLCSSSSPLQWPSQQRLRGPCRVDIRMSRSDGELDTSPPELLVYEDASKDDLIIGIALTLDATAPTPDSESDNFFAALITEGLHINSRDDESNQVLQDRDDIIDSIVEHFNTSLRYITKDDMWARGGQDYFRARISHYVERGQKIEFCLPAFPCKSSHPGKVQGVSPDRGEYIALTHLDDFIQGIERLYRPGAKLWVISDGHVFSDCIGVDDGVVDSYGEQLIAMSERIAMSRGGVDRIGFKSLLDLLKLERLEGTKLLESSIPPLQHHIATKMTDEAETCRRILQRGFQVHPQELRRRIDSKELGIIALYRGFSRFMLEDLALNPYTSALSQSQRRKLSAKVAFEMIQRNQAYSNLVEVMFPYHVRLSIHAHNNAGPKFGIQLFGNQVRATNELSPDGDLVKSHDQLHVPTPWHNCIVEIQGHSTLYITKSSVAQGALAGGAFKGGWTPLCTGGGSFHLEPAL
ncbi:hypothetical protein HIM_09596 [Hirsutella minnesotensis 3608]|uniref:Pyoverdine/dityrosine biosynthesis protein n=1 Tax=Hirsutella minnesotensis 3608 TaxID=1043627 RepID=A0A0F7ZXN2_9HYPO|nr:hypothetical protein HIM_09596 [Hirsutella minnesotensis 3608]